MIFVSLRQHHLRKLITAGDTNDLIKHLITILKHQVETDFANTGIKIESKISSNM